MRDQLPGGAVRTQSKHLTVEFPVLYVPGAPRQWQHSHQRSLIIDHHDKYNNHKKFELLSVTKNVAQEANVVGKRALIHLLYTRSLKNFNWSQVQHLKSAIKTCVYFVYNLVSWKPPHTVSASALQSMDSGRSGVPGASARRPARMGPSRGAGYALQPHTGARSAGGPGQRAESVTTPSAQVRPEDCTLRMPAIRFCDRAVQDSHGINRSLYISTQWSQLYQSSFYCMLY